MFTCNWTVKSFFKFYINRHAAAASSNLPITQSVPKEGEDVAVALINEKTDGTKDATTEPSVKITLPAQNVIRREVRSEYSYERK